MEKKILPWKIRVGMQSSFGDRSSRDYINRYRVLTVEYVQKQRAVLCSGYKWKVKFDNGEVRTYHGQTGILPPKRFSQLIEEVQK